MPVIDADAHVNEDALGWPELDQLHPGWLAAAQSGGRWVACIENKLYPAQEGPGCGVPVDSAVNESAAAGAADLDQRLRDMDAEGIDVQVLFGGLSLGVTTFDDAGFALDFARTYNDWLLDKICSHAPDRLKGVAAVPLQSMSRALDELHRVARTGAVAVTIPPVLGQRNLDDPVLFPFFAAAADLDIAIAVHSAPGMNIELPAAGRFSNYAQVHCLSFPVDQMVAFTALAMGGVFDRLPTLRVGFMESGIGWVPYFVHRSAEHLEKRPELLPLMTCDPRDYLDRGQCYFSFEAEEPLLHEYIDHLGDTSIVYASDYPHWDSDFPGTVEEVRSHAADLGPSTLERIMATNAARFYALDHASTESPSRDSSATDTPLE